MRHIEIETGLRLRFPNRDTAFVEGVEIGLIAARLAAGLQEVIVRIGAGTLEQARDLARGLGYRAVPLEAAGDWVEVRFEPLRARPRLRIVG